MLPCKLTESHLEEVDSIEWSGVLPANAGIVQDGFGMQKECQIGVLVSVIFLPSTQACAQPYIMMCCSRRDILCSDYQCSYRTANHL